MSDVHVIKLSSGEEIVTRLQVKGDYLVFEKPLTLVQVPGQNGQVGMAVAPWIMSGVTDSVEVSLNWVVADVPAKQEIANMYLEQTTGLSLASADTSKLQL